MTNMGDSIRKHQKVILLSVALAVLVLYILPLDHLFAAAQSIKERFLKAMEKAKSKIPVEKGKKKITRAEYRVIAKFNRACLRGVVQLC